MKKIMISLLLVAATMSAMAVTYTGKAKLTLTSSDSKSCTLTIGESGDLGAGLNPGYYAELNTEGKEVWFFVEYGGVKYQQFASNAATMEDLQLGIKTNASTSYTLTAASVVGTLKIRINGVEYNITEGMSEVITLPASSTLPAVGDEANYKVQPTAPAEFQICFRDNELQITANPYAENVVVKDENGTKVVNEAPVTPYQAIDLSALAAGRYTVELADGARKYVIVKQ